MQKRRGTCRAAQSLLCVSSRCLSSAVAQLPHFPGSALSSQEDSFFFYCMAFYSSRSHSRRFHMSPGSATGTGERETNATQGMPSPSLPGWSSCRPSVYPSWPLWTLYIASASPRGLQHLPLAFVPFPSFSTYRVLHHNLPVLPLRPTPQTPRTAGAA